MVMAKKPTVSADEARRIAQQTVGKYPPSKPPRSIVKRGTGLSEAEKKIVQKKAPVKITKVAPKSKAEIAKAKAAERNARLKQVLKPLLSRGTPAKGERRSPAAEKEYKANKSGARVLSADEARANAQRKARDIEAAKDAKMRDAARIRDEKFRQDRPGPNTKAESINQAEADARTKKGLEEIKKAEKAKAKLNKKKPTVIKTTRGGGGIRGPLGGPGGGAMGWENK
jgi:hypothetical protein